MEEKIKLSRIYIIATLIMIAVGIAALVIAFAGDPQRGWANLPSKQCLFCLPGRGSPAVFVHPAGNPFGLVGRFYSGSGSHGGPIFQWQQCFSCCLIFGAHSLYHWSHTDAVSSRSAAGT